MVNRFLVDFNYCANESDCQREVESQPGMDDAAYCLGEG